jgi:HEAT repeat protein
MLTVVFAAALTLAAQDDPEVTAAIDRFKTAMKSPSPAQRADAVMELAKTPHAKTAALIIPLLQSDLLPVRQSAAKALGSFEDQKKTVLPALQHAIAATSSDPNVVVMILEALGKLGDASSIPAVQKCFYDKESRVVRQAIAVAGTLPAATSIDPLIDLLRRQEKIVKNNSAGGSVMAGGDVNGNNKVVAKSDENLKKSAEDIIKEIDKSLGSITGETLSGSQQWQAWWNQAKGSFKIKK